MSVGGLARHLNDVFANRAGTRLGFGMPCKACPEPDSEEYEALCPEGPSKDNGGRDINECTMIPGVCAHGACENLDPGYRCICDPGFHADADGVCRDIDECDMHQSVSTALGVRVRAMAR